MPGTASARGQCDVRAKGNTAGSGGRVRRGLEGKGPTPKAEDRPYHSAYRAKKAAVQRTPGPPSTPKTGRPGSGPEWVAGRNAVLEAMEAEIPIQDRVSGRGSRTRRPAARHSQARRKSGHGTPRGQQVELDRLTGGALHQGIALQLPTFEYAHPDDLLAAALDSDRESLIVALDSITDPRNLGAIVRSAAAFGAHGVLIPERRSAGMTAAAWKTSAGAAARIPIARATNLNRSLRAYANAGLSLIGLDGRAVISISDMPDISGPIVLVVGSEGAGLSRLVREACDTLAAIPISTSVESLNAGVAAGIALYEISRHRVGGLD